MGPYSSALTNAQVPLTQDAGKLTIAGGAAATSVFEGRDLTFGTFMPSKQYLDSAIALLATKKVKTIASFYEDASFTSGVCSALSDLTKEYGIDLIYMRKVQNHPTKEMLDPIAAHFKMMESQPDAVVSCVYEKGCESWVQAMRHANWSPKAQVFTVCVGKDSFETAIGSDDAEFLLGVSSWDKSMAVKDAITGWVASDFHDLFFEYTQNFATYQAASGAASLGVLVQALEKAQDWTNTKEVASVLMNETFPTLYGYVSFDKNGQNMQPFLTLQYKKNEIDGKLSALGVFPPKNIATEFLYPMPTVSMLKKGEEFMHFHL